MSGPTPPGTGVSAPATPRTGGVHVPHEHVALPLELVPARVLHQLAGESRVLHAVHPHVHHHRPRLDVLGADEPRPPRRGHEQVGLPQDRAEVARP